MSFAPWSALLLVLVLGFAREDRPTPEARYDTLAARFTKAQKDFFEAVRAEPDQAKRRALYDQRPGPEFLPEFKALATEARGTEVAAKCWMQFAEISGDFEQAEDFKLAVDVLLADHVDSPALDTLPMMIGSMRDALGPERADQALEKLVAASPRAPVRAGAVFQLAQFAMDSDDPAARAKARPLLERLVKEFGDLAVYGRTYKDVAAGFLFELDHLQIGMTAPDFEGTDENGVKFKLSDYRGKVVVLDFWGYW